MVHPKFQLIVLHNTQLQRWYSKLNSVKSLHMEAFGYIYTALNCLQEVIESVLYLFLSVGETRDVTVLKSCDSSCHWSWRSIMEKINTQNLLVYHNSLGSTAPNNATLPSSLLSKHYLPSFLTFMRALAQLESLPPSHWKSWRIDQV